MFRTQRLNVTWQSSNLRWNRGFFTRLIIPTGAKVEDASFSLDEALKDGSGYSVDYDLNSFEWVSVDYSTPQGADCAWAGPDPKYIEIVTYTEATADQCEKYDQMAYEFLAGTGGDSTREPALASEALVTW